MTTTQNYATFSNGSKTVNVLLGNENPVKHSFDKMLIILPIPKQYPPKTWTIDLGRLQQTITFIGFLMDEEADTMYNKKNNLMSILATTGNITVVWDTNQATNPLTGVVYTGNIMKCDITEQVFTLGDSRNYGSDDTKVFAVTIQFIVGDFKG